MGVEPIMEEPSVGGILDCIRRIMADEQDGLAGIRPNNKPCSGELILTRMVTADGSIVTISPDLHRKCRPASAPASRDPFAEFELLKKRVAALISNNRCGGAVDQAHASNSKLIVAKGENVAQSAQALKLNRCDFAELVEPTSLHDVAPLLAQRGDSCSARPDRYAGVQIEVELSNGLSIPVKKIAKDPLPLSGDVSSRRTKERQAARGRASVARLAVLAPTRRSEAVGPLEETPCSIEATNQIERMLGYQIAAAHEAAMTLTSAAMHSIHNSSEVGSDHDSAPSSGNDARSRGRIREDGVEAARLANAAARMMRAYNESLAILGLLRGGGQRNTTMQQVTDQYGGRATHRITRGGNGRGRRGPDLGPLSTPAILRWSQQDRIEWH